MDSEQNKPSEQQVTEDNSNDDHQSVDSKASKPVSPSGGPSSPSKEKSRDSSQTDTKSESPSLKGSPKCDISCKKDKDKVQTSNEENTENNNTVDAKSSESVSSATVSEAGSSPDRAKPKESSETESSKDYSQESTEPGKEDNDKTSPSPVADPSVPASAETQQPPKSIAVTSEPAISEGTQCDSAKPSETADGSEEKKAQSKGEKDKPDKENKNYRRNRSNRRGRRPRNKSDNRRNTTNTSGDEQAVDDQQQQTELPRRRSYRPRRPQWNDGYVDSYGYNGYKPRGRGRMQNMTNDQVVDEQQQAEAPRRRPYRPYRPQWDDGYVDPYGYSGYVPEYRPRGRGRMQNRNTYVNYSGLPSPPYRRNFGSSYSSDGNYRRPTSTERQGRDRPGFYAARIVRPTKHTTN